MAKDAEALAYIMLTLSLTYPFTDENDVVQHVKSSYGLSETDARALYRRTVEQMKKSGQLTDF